MHHWYPQLPPQLRGSPAMVVRRGMRALGTGDRELGTGDRELGAGDRELGTGDVIFARALCASGASQTS